MRWPGWLEYEPGKRTILSRRRNWPAIGFVHLAPAPHLEVLKICSRQSTRWVLPGGWSMKGPQATGGGSGARRRRGSWQDIKRRLSDHQAQDLGCGALSVMD